MKNETCMWRHFQLFIHTSATTIICKHFLRLNNFSCCCCHSSPLFVDDFFIWCLLAIWVDHDPNDACLSLSFILAWIRKSSSLFFTNDANNGVGRKIFFNEWANDFCYIVRACLHFNFFLSDTRHEIYY